MILGPRLEMRRTCLSRYSSRVSLLALIQIANTQRRYGWKKLSWGMKISEGWLHSDPCRSIRCPLPHAEGMGKTCVKKSVF